MRTSRSLPASGRLCHSTPLTTVNSAVFKPMPMAMLAMTVAVEAGRLRRIRIA